MLTRRKVLGGGAALAGAAIAAPALAAGPRLLRAAPAQVRLAPAEFPETAVWAYDGRVPGPVLRQRRGDRLQVTLENGIAHPTTVHWHGVRLPVAMDGMPGFSQDPVLPGGRFDYAFDLLDAGTFWYHPHEMSLEQVARGLYGVLIVDEEVPPEVDRDEVIVLDDWRLDETAQIHESFGNLHDMAHAGRYGNFVTANGSDAPQLQVTRGERLRLRLVNVATDRIFDLRFSGLAVWVVALDGMPLAAPERAEAVTLGPAQRADVIIDVTLPEGGEALLVSVEQAQGYALVSLPVAAGREPRPAPPDPLEPNRVAPLDLAGAVAARMVMQGGAMRGLPEGAVHKGERLDFRALAERGQVWAFNGVAGMAPEPLVAAGLGQTVRMPLVNDTAFPHAIHLHGHHFHVFSDGVPGPLRDTVLVMPGETREIAFVADNPGNWMLHCHMLSHQMSGMMNWVRVG